MIAEADVFQLFWSSNSMRSPYVRQEWECALKLGRPQFVRPVYWEDPLPHDDIDGLPPAELAEIHFFQYDTPPPNTTPRPLPVVVPPGSPPGVSQPSPAAPPPAQPHPPLSQSQDRTIELPSTPAAWDHDQSTTTVGSVPAWDQADAELSPSAPRWPGFDTTTVRSSRRVVLALGVVLALVAVVVVLVVLRR